MDNETDVTREEMDETRASLSEKLETLEQQVADTVHGAANVVDRTVDNVNDAMEMVENVKDTFDLRLQVARSPWAMVGGSIALGYLGGYLLFRHGAAQPRANGKSQPAPPDNPPVAEKQKEVVKGPRFQEEASVKMPVRDPAPAVVDPGCLGRVHNRYRAEMNQVKGLAIGAVLGVVRDAITQSAPELFKAGLADVIDGITVKLGGEPIHGPVWKDVARAAGERQDEPHPSVKERSGAAAPRQCQRAGATVP